MAGDVRVTIGANLAVTTSGVEEAKRAAAEVQAATEGVNASARDAGAAVSDAMSDAAQAARDAADALRRTAQQQQPAAPAGLSYDPRTHAHRASTMLYGVEAHLAGGVTSQAQLAQLEARTKRAGFYVDAAREGGLPERQTQDLIDHLQAVTDALTKNRDALEESTREGASLAPRQPDDENTPTNRLLGTLIGEVRGLAGAGLGQFGALGRLLTGVGGIAGGIALAGGAAYAGWNLLRRNLTAGNEAARDELIAMSDLGRQYDTSDNPLAWFRQTSGRFTGFTDPDIARLGYSGTQAGAFMARLDLPSGEDDPTSSGRADTRTGLAFARATGMQEDAVASFMRTLGVGGIQRGESERALTLIREAMREGVKEGVSTSDTFRTMEQTLTGMFRGGVNLTEAGIAFQSGLATAAARSGNRQWQGEQGAANLDRLQAAMLGGGDMGMELALLNRTGGFTATDLGLEGVHAANYETMRSADRVGAARVAIDLARTNPAVMQRFARALQGLLGNNIALLTHYLRQLGITGYALLEYIGEDGIARLAEQAVAEGERAATGDALVDVQRGNVLAAETLAVRVAEQDAELGRSFARLDLTGDPEIGMRRFGVTSSAILSQIARGFGTRDLFAPYGAEPGRVGGGHDLIFDEFTNAPPREGFTVRSGYDDAVTRMAGGIEATRGDATNMSPLAAQRGGAFGWTQILASNLTGNIVRNTNSSVHGGWDKWFIGQDSAAGVRQMMLNAGFEDFDDPIPDHIASGGAEALAEWRNSLTPEQQEAIDALMLQMSSAMMQDYGRIAEDVYGIRDPDERLMRSIAAWYMGPGEGYGGKSVLDPAFEMDEGNPWFRRSQSDGGIPLRDYLKKFGYEFGEDAGPEGNLPAGATLTIRFEGLERITVEGATAAQNDRVQDAAREFIGAIVGPSSYRGA